MRWRQPNDEFFLRNIGEGYPQGASFSKKPSKDTRFEEYPYSSLSQFTLLPRSPFSLKLTFTLDVTKETVCFTIDTSSEEEFVSCTRSCSITELQGPQAIDHN
jgi:hypothetical protein